MTTITELDSLLVVTKGYMSLGSAWDVYNSVICSNPHVAHFRLASAGSKSPELTHPFVIAPDSPLVLRAKGETLKVLFHNGTVSGWKDMIMPLALANKKWPVGELSDTRVMAMGISMIGDGPLYFDGGRYVIASRDGFALYGTWLEYEGIRFSNLGFNITRVTYTGGRAWNGWDVDKHGNVIFDRDEDPSLFGYGKYVRK
jgi:hypothetical protein